MAVLMDRRARHSRYMPRRGYPPTQTWRTFLRNQAFAIGTAGLGEAGRLSDALRALVRGRIARVVGCVTKVRDGILCRLIEPSHRLPPYRSSYRTDRRAVHGRCVAIPPWPTTLGAGNWSMAARRLSPYQSRGLVRSFVPMLSTQECANYFSHAGYAPV
jgi:hypothetical protein